MKTFNCGSVVPGCTVTFTGQSEEDILGQVAVHAEQDHGLAEIPEEVLARVREQIAEV